LGAGAAPLVCCAWFVPAPEREQDCSLASGERGRVHLDQCRSEREPLPSALLELVGPLRSRGLEVSHWRPSPEQVWRSGGISAGSCLSVTPRMLWERPVLSPWGQLGLWLLARRGDPGAVRWVWVLLLKPWLCRWRRWGGLRKPQICFCPFCPCQSCFSPPSTSPQLSIWDPRPDGGLGTGPAPLPGPQCPASPGAAARGGSPDWRCPQCVGAVPGPSSCHPLAPSHIPTGSTQPSFSGGLPQNGRAVASPCSSCVILRAHSPQ